MDRLGLMPCSSAASPTKILKDDPAWKPEVPLCAGSELRLMYVWPLPEPIGLDCAIATIAPVPGVASTSAEATLSEA